MADSQIETIDVSLADGVSATAAKMADSLDKLGQAADSVTETVKKVGPSLSSVSKSIDENTAYNAKAEAAARKYAAALDTLRTAADQGKISADQLATGEQRLATIRDNAIASAARQRDAMAQLFAQAQSAATATDALTAAQGRSAAALQAASGGMDAVSAAAAKATSYQAALNQALGVKPPSDYDKRAEDIQAYGNEMDRLRAKYDPLFAASKKYSDSVDEISQLEKVGVFNKAQAQVALQNLTKAYADTSTNTDKATKSHEGFSLASAGATRELIVLGHEAITGNFSRIPGSLLVMAERAGGLHDILGTVGTAASTLGGIVAIAGAVVVAGLTGMAVAAERASDRLLTMQNTLRATRDDYVSLSAAAEAAARDVAATSASSLTDTRGATGIIAASPNFVGSKADLEDYARIAENLAKVLGTDLKTAGKDVVDILNNPMAAALKYAQAGMFGFNLVIADHIKILQESGKAQEAASEVIDQVKSHTDGATDNVTKLSKAWTDFKNVFVSPSTEAGSFFISIGNFIADLTAKVLNAVTAITNGIASIGNAASKFLNIRTNTIYDSGNRTPLPTVLENGLPQVPASASLKTWDQGQSQADAAQTPNGTVMLGPVTRYGWQAIGAMQVSPDTAKAQGFNPYDSTGNVLDGLSYIKKLIDMQTSAGTPRFPTLDGVASAYNGGPGVNPAATIGYVNSVKNATPVGGDIGSLIDFWGPVLGLTADQIDFGKRIAKVESGGNQYRTTGSNPVGSLTGPTNTILNNAQTTLDSVNPLVRQQSQNFAQQSALEAGMSAAQAAGDTKAYNEFAAALDLVKSKAADLIPEQEKMARASQDNIQPLVAEAGATRDVAEIKNKYFLAARSSTNGLVDESAMQTEITNKLYSLRVAHEDNIKVLDASTAAQNAVNAAYGNGAASVIEATNRTKAEIEVKKTALVGTTDFTRQVDELTAAYDRQSASKAAAQTFALSFAQNNEIQQLQLEESLLGQSNDTRDKEIALLKERQRIIQAGGTAALDTAESQASLKRVAQISDETAALKIQQNAINELGTFGEQTFNTIGTAITQAFATGSIKALNFKDLMKSVFSSIAQEILKLAVLNPVMNSLFGGDHRTTIGDVGGIVGSLLGGSSGGTSGTSTGTGAGSAASSSSSLGDVAKLASAVKDLFSTGSGGIGSSIASGITNLFGNAQAASSIAYDAVGQVPAVLTPTQLATASIANGIGLSDSAASAITSATTTISQALPYIGTAVGVITDLVQGNIKGAAFTAGGAGLGAAIGSVIPGLGTALGAGLGAALGGLASSLFGGHPLSKYEDTALVTENGYLAKGKSVNQVESSSGSQDAVASYADGLNAYLHAAKIELNITSGQIIGKVGDMDQGKPGADVNDPSLLFNRMVFRPDDTVDPASNYGIAAKGALDGKKFDNINALQDSLTSIANFSDNLDTLGIHLKSVGQDLTNIQIASVDPATSNNQPASPLRTALSNDLPGQTFADTDALTAEINKVNQFVNGTIPSLLNPVIDTSSSMMTQIAAINVQYANAIDQAQKYGLATDDLAAAQQKAIAIIQAPALHQLDESNLAIQLRGAQASGGDTSAIEAEQTANSEQDQRDALKKQYTDIYGSLVPEAKQYQAALDQLNSTLAAERIAAAKKVADALAATEQASLDATLANKARLEAAQGNQLGADLINEDQKLKQERDSFAASYSATADYQDKLTALESAQQAERLQIVQKAAADQVAAASKNASDAAASALGTITGQTGGGSAATTQMGQQAALFAFDQSAGQLRANFAAAMEGALGKGKDFADAMISYDTGLAAQRLAIEQGYGADLLKIQQQVANDNVSLQVRAMNALGDAAGASALQARQQDAATRAATVAEGGDVALLDLTTALETANATAKTASTTLTTALAAQTTALQNQISTLQQNTDALKSAADSLTKFSTSLNTSASSPLSPAAQLAAAQQAMADDLKTITDMTLDQTTRSNAGQQLQADAQTRLGIAESYYGKSTAGYAGEFADTQAGLTTGAASLAGSQGVAEKSLMVLQAQLQLTQAYSDQAAAIGTDQSSKAAQAVGVAKDNLNQAIALAKGQGDVSETAQQQLKTTLDTADAQRAALAAGNAQIVSANGDLLSVDKLGNLITQTTADQQLAALNAGNAQALALGNSTADAIGLLASAVTTAGDAQKALQDALKQQLADSQAASAAQAAAQKQAADAAAAQAKAAADALLQQQKDAAAAAAQAAADAKSFADRQALATKESADIDAFLMGRGAAPSVAPDVAPPTAAALSDPAYSGRYVVGYNIQQVALQDLGREFSNADLQPLIDSIMSGTSNLGNLADYLPTSAEGQWYKQKAGLVNGGSVGNGTYNQDSVIAAYAGGGNIMLAGGEYVVNARQAAQYADILPEINRGAFRQAPANDSGSTAELRGIRAELQQLRAQVATHTKVTADGAVQVRDAVKAGLPVAKEQAKAAKLANARVA